MHGFPWLGPRQIGIFCALMTAAVFGSQTTFASIFYETGGSAATVTLMRFIAASVIYMVLCLISGVSLKPDRQSLPALAGAAFCWTVVNFCYLGSVRYIPVSLAVLIFFTFPMIVAAVTAIMEKRWLRVSEIAQFLLAFTGLALALGPRFDQLAPLGILLAALAACTLAGQLLFTQALLLREPSNRILLQVNLVAMSVSLPIVFAGDLFAMPLEGSARGISGTLGLAIASLGYVIALLFQMEALKRIRAVEMALYFNLEPLVTLAVAALLLSETLSPLQMLGASLVICALFSDILVGGKKLFKPFKS